MMNKVLGKEMHEGIAPDRGMYKSINLQQDIFDPLKTQQICGFSVSLARRTK